MRVVLALATVAAALLASTSASAYRTENTYGLVASANGCNGCHTSAQVPAPTLTVTQVTADPLTVGGSAIFDVKITSGRADPTAGKAAFAAGVKNAGTFIAGTVAGSETAICGSAGQPGCSSGFSAIRDVTRRAWGSCTGCAAADYDWQIELDDLKAGSFTLNVGGNDVDGNGNSGGLDHNNHTTLAFVVAEGEGEGEGAAAGEGEGAAAGEGEGAAAGEGEGAAAGEGEGEGDDQTPPPVTGCSATGSGGAVPVGALLALGLLAVRLRRRSR
ncbi:MAG TPA: MYXO-CTERM sorting domain-containing protein [Myxococcota bacterium]|jgi:uncharacterized protein (TIGR03382 family)